MKPEDCKTAAAPPGDSSISARQYLGGGPSAEVWRAWVSVSGRHLTWMPFPPSVAFSFSQSAFPRWGGQLQPGSRPVASQERCYTQADVFSMQNRVMGPGSGVSGLMLRAVASSVLWAGCLTRQMCSCRCSLSLCWAFQVFPIWSSTDPQLQWGYWNNGVEWRNTRALQEYSPLPSEPFTQGSRTQSMIKRLMSPPSRTYCPGATSALAQQPPPRAWPFWSLWVRK